MQERQTAPAGPIPASARAAFIDATIQLENAAAAASIITEGSSRDSSTSIHIQGASSTSVHTAQISALQTDNAPALLSDPDLQTPEFSRRIVRGLTSMINQRGGVMNMRLDPPELGELRIQMTLAHGNVSAEFHAGTQQAQAMLDKHIAVLRHALEAQGLTIDRLTVHLTPTGTQHSMRDDSGSHESSRQQHQHNAAGGESRGRGDDRTHDAPRQFRRFDFDRAFPDLAVASSLS